MPGAGIARSVLLQPDGKIVLAGSMREVGRFDDELAVARVDGRGSLDATFDPGGADGDGKKVFTDDTRDLARAVVVQPDGRIVLAGRGSGPEYAVTRLNQNGSVDGTTFKLGGLDSADAAALTPEGELVVAGSGAVAHFKPDGSPDGTLGGTGTAMLDHPELVEAMLVQPDGKIVVAGASGSADLRTAVTRLNRDGSPDTGFGQGGTSFPDFDGEDLAYAVALQPDGKLLVAGGNTAGGFTAARLDAAGMLDPSFGAGGKTTIGFGEIAVAAGAALQPDGRLVLAGVTASLGIPLVRLQADPPAGGGAGPGGGPDAGPTATPHLAQRCAGRRATIVGSARGETLRGTQRADVIVALGGNDRVLAGGGRDTVCGGPGNDRISGGSGADRLLGERGRDVLLGSAGRDRMMGGAGSDRCVAGPARDRSQSCGTGRTP